MGDCVWRRPVLLIDYATATRSISQIWLEYAFKQACLPVGRLVAAHIEMMA